MLSPSLIHSPSQFLSLQWPFDHDILSPSLMELFHHNLQNPSLLEKMMIKEFQSAGDDHGKSVHRVIFPSNSHSQLNVFSPNTSCYSNDTVLDGVDQPDGGRRRELNGIMAERKLRRMISNRESARRSRMRKKRQIEELQYQVSQLEGSNRQLSEKLIELLECNQQMVHENAELKHKVSSLQTILTDFLTPLRNLEDVFCSPSRLRAEASNSSHH